MRWQRLPKFPSFPPNICMQCAVETESKVLYLTRTTLVSIGTIALNFSLSVTTLVNGRGAEASRAP